MNWNLFIKETRKNILSLFVWMLVLTLLISLTMSVYRTFLDNQSKVLAMMNLVPKGALQFKGISNFSDLLSVLGFYSVNNIIYMMVLGSIYAIVLGSNILLKEEYNKTAEYLLTRPLTRSEIFNTKSAVVFLGVACLNLVTTIAGFISLELVKTGPFSIRAFLTLSLYTFLLNLLFGAAGIFMSTLVKRAKPITTFGIGLVLVFYFIYTISKITDSAKILGYLSPFKYVNVNATDPAYTLGFWHLVYFLGISVLLTGLAFRLYKHKDIYT
jgi:ABC-2 type transport system permease protein